jgi:aryl-alcohol dehydrogenase-like predicted oxidoreductase
VAKYLERLALVYSVNTQLSVFIKKDRMESKFIIGTANFGQVYGTICANRLSKKHIKEVLDLAGDSGINTLDTAEGYGEAIAVCASYPDSGRLDVVAKIRFGETISHVAKIYSKSKLKVSAILVHLNPLNLPTTGELLVFLSELRSYKIFAKVGLSLYNESDIDDCILNHIDIVQIPYSVFDKRFCVSGFIKTAKAKQVEIHARSIFLQGLILAEPDQYEPKFAEHKGVFEKFRDYCFDQNSSKLEIAVFFALSNPYIDKIVLGVDSARQLSEILGIESKFNSTEFLEPPDFTHHDIKLILPYLW